MRLNKTRENDANKRCSSRAVVFTPVTLATWENKIRRISVQGQTREIVLKTPSPK
jgi:hypothetical protein